MRGGPHQSLARFANRWNDDDQVFHLSVLWGVSLIRRLTDVFWFAAPMFFTIHRHMISRTIVFRVKEIVLIAGWIKDKRTVRMKFSEMSTMAFLRFDKCVTKFPREWSSQPLAI